MTVGLVKEYDDDIHLVESLGSRDLLKFKKPDLVGSKAHLL